MRAFILAVTGLAYGVTACSSGGTSVEVQRKPVAAVSVVLPSPSLSEGQTARAVATPRDANGSALTNRPIAWQSSSSAIASVTDSGMISAVAPGNTVISATSEGVSGQASMSVIPPSPAPVASVSVSLVASSINPGQSTQASATTRDANNNVLGGRAISWSSSNTSIATVSGSGLVTAVAVGTAQITATSEGQAGSATLTVSSTPPVPVASVSVALAASSRNPGQTTQATATTRDANNNVLTGRAISWSSSNTSIATVSGSGLITAVAVGTAQITATSEGQAGSATLTVVSPPPIPVASVSVTLAASSRNPGQNTQATATTRDANNNVLTGRVITWSSSNTGVATVSGSGLVTAIAVGTAQIMAACEGQNGNATLTVASPPPPVPVASVSVALGNSSLNPGLTTQATATTRDANSNVLTGRVITWSSSNIGVATVSASGLVIAVALGPVQITAMSESVSGSAGLNVVAPPPPPPPGSWNEPAGMTVVAERPFNSLTEAPAWDTDNSLSIISDNTAPLSPSNVIRATYPAGFPAGSAPGHAGLAHAGYNTLYIRFASKLSSTWVGNGAGTSKIMYEWTQGPNPAFFLGAHGIGGAELLPYAYLQGVVSAPHEYNLAPNLDPSARIIRGQWQLFEILLTGNSAGAANGTIDWWVDGVHVGHTPSIQWTTGATTFNVFEFRPVWGGVETVPAITQTQTMDWDNVYISGKN